jgi:hypothetical protein
MRPVVGGLSAVGRQTVALIICPLGHFVPIDWFLVALARLETQRPLIFVIPILVDVIRLRVRERDVWRCKTVKW